ncbi:MAG TPA: hypothetical protein VLM85_11650 [Polyangiaceae bacterium]|nr:hypothetical protein [Polyangiaceae bacterium]
MPKTRSHRTKLAPLPSAKLLKDVTAKVDPKLEAEWKKLQHRIEDAQGRGAEAYDELWEAVGAAVSHDPPLYVLGGYKSAADFFQRLLHTDPRTALRSIEVARYATPTEEEQYGTSNLYAAIQYVEAKHGALGSSLPVAFERLKVPVKDGAHTKMVLFKNATFAEIEAATRDLQRKKTGAPPTDRAAKAIDAALGKHKAFAKVRFTVQGGLVHVRGIPLASLDLFARVLGTVKLPPVEAPKKAAKKAKAAKKK